VLFERAQVSSLDGDNGFVAVGVDDGDQAGYSVSSGDVNGDGELDVISFLAAHCARAVSLLV